MSLIKNLDYFACGSCENKVNRLFRQEQSKMVTFPAGVFLIKHEEKGYLLYDSGYDPGIVGRNLKYWLYRLPNPIQMSPDQAIDAQLLKRGISPDEIRMVFISHLHPDHIGRLRAFTEATFVLTSDCYKTYRQSRFRDLVFKEYFPEDFDQRCQVLELTGKLPLLERLPATDVFGDGSLWAFSLDGHAKGQLCLWVKDWQVVLAADTVWQWAFLPKTPYMKALPRQIQDDFSAYLASVTVLQELESQGMTILVSHDAEQRIREVLNA